MESRRSYAHYAVCRHLDSILACLVWGGSRRISFRAIALSSVFVMLHDVVVAKVQHLTRHFIDLSPTKRPSTTTATNNINNSDDDDDDNDKRHSSASKSRLTGTTLVSALRGQATTAE